MYNWYVWDVSSVFCSLLTSWGFLIANAMAFLWSVEGVWMERDKGFGIYMGVTCIAVSKINAVV